MTSLLLSQPLHFGDYGGMPVKVIWAALDVVTIVILVTGLYLWLFRRRAAAEPRGGLRGTGARCTRRSGLDAYTAAAALSRVKDLRAAFANRFGQR